MLRVRWRALDTGARFMFAAISALMLGAIGVRVWLMVIYRPALLGFSDSAAYLRAAAHDIFGDPQHPAGYPLFLRLVHHLSSNLASVILVQHALGVMSGVLLYRSLRRLAVPPWLGLIPAAVVFFGGTGVLLEHSPLADPLLTFLQAVGIYAVVRALATPARRWPLTAGLATGAAFWVKTVALTSALLIPVVLLVAAAGERSRRVKSASMAGGAIALVIFAYFASHAYFTGSWGYERQSAWNLYARVATFVDCTHFTPPRGTAFLCPPEPPSRRQAVNYFQYDSHAPAVLGFHGPARAPRSANAVLERFSVAAIEHEPLTYAGAVARSLSYYVFPREGEGYSPRAIGDALLDTGTQRSGESLRALPAVALLFPHGARLQRSAAAVHSISSYERHTRIGGVLMVVLLLASLGCALLPRGPTRAAAVFLGLTALLSITFAVATNAYDARYAYPTFGPLAACAALGGWAAAGALLLRLRSWRVALARRNSRVRGC